MDASMVKKRHKIFESLESEANDHYGVNTPDLKPKNNQEQILKVKEVTS
jgi:hypothetical protein